MTNLLGGAIGVRIEFVVLGDFAHDARTFFHPAPDGIQPLLRGANAEFGAGQYRLLEFIL